jgi:hypothetical protein
MPGPVFTGPPDGPRAESSLLMQRSAQSTGLAQRTSSRPPREPSTMLGPGQRAAEGVTGTPARCGWAAGGRPAAADRGRATITSRASAGAACDRRGGLDPQPRGARPTRGWRAGTHRRPSHTDASAVLCHARRASKPPLRESRALRPPLAWAPGASAVTGGAGEVGWQDPRSTALPKNRRCLTVRRSS